MQRDNSSEFSSLAGFGKTKLPSASRVTPIEEVRVRVLTDQDVFDRFITEAFDALDVRWASVGNGSVLPFTLDQWRKYCYTAVRARVARVNNERFHSRCDDPWTVHPVLAAALAGVGIVQSEAPVVMIRPVWDPELNSATFETKEEVSSMTRRLRSLELNHDMGMVYAHAIAGQRSGSEAIMALLPVRAANGALTQVRSKADIDPLAATAFFIVGLAPEDWTEVLIPAHPLLAPPYYYDLAQLMPRILEWAEAGTGK